MSSWRLIAIGLLAALIAVVLASMPGLARGGQSSAQAMTAGSTGTLAISMTGPSQAPALSAQQQGGNSQDVLEKVLLTLGVVGVGAVICLIGYVIRRQTGFWLHRPPASVNEATEEHH